MWGGAWECEEMLKGMKVCSGGIRGMGWSLGSAVAVGALEAEPMTMPTCPTCPCSVSTLRGEGGAEPS